MADRHRKQMTNYLASHKTKTAAGGNTASASDSNSNSAAQGGSDNATPSLDRSKTVILSSGDGSQTAEASGSGQATAIGDRSRTVTLDSDGTSKMPATSSSNRGAAANGSNKTVATGASSSKTSAASGSKREMVGSGSNKAVGPSGGGKKTSAASNSNKDAAASVSNREAAASGSSKTMVASNSNKAVASSAGSSKTPASSSSNRAVAASGSSKLSSKPPTRTTGKPPQRNDKPSTSKLSEHSDTASERGGKSADDVPVMFTSSSRTGASFLAMRRRAPVRITGPACINNLPDELLMVIFSYLGAGDLLTAGRVCKRWQPLANDNLLWDEIFARYGNLGAAVGGAGERRSISDYKAICIKTCSDKRNKKAIRFLKKISPFTGLPRDNDKALKSAGVYFHLCLIDHYDKEHVLASRDVFHHQMATCVRWYDLEPPPIKSLKELRVYSVNPLFFEKNGSAVSNSPYQRSLLLSLDFDWSKWTRTNKPSGGDDMLNVYTLTDGIIVATWKRDGELAFLCQGLHCSYLVQRCLYGNSTEPYDVGKHKVVLDDIDPSYGLHGYRCTVEIRTLRNSIWSQQFNSLYCKKETVGSGYATFPLIRQDYHCDHVILQKKLNFPWKTDAFKGTIEGIVWLDLTVLDEQNEAFWCISTCAKVTGQRQANCFDFDYSTEDTCTLTYMDTTGKLEANLSLTDDKDYFMSHMDLKLSLDAINGWFGTSYK